MEAQQSNPLEQILKLAADEPAHRPEFLNVLLDSTIFVIGRTGQDEGIVNLEAGSSVEIQNWEKADGTPIIPFFSSLEVLQKSIDIEQSYLAIPAKVLFEMIQGKALVLNPKSPYGKEFVPEEVKNLLSIGVSQKPIQRIVERETKVLLGQPSKYPEKMVDSLTKLFMKHNNVKRAFLALMHDTSVDEKSHLIIGIEVEDDAELILRETGNVAGDTAPDGEAVDIYLVSANDAGLSNYFLTQTKPFYQRKWSAKLRSFFF